MINIFFGVGYIICLILVCLGAIKKGAMSKSLTLIGGIVSFILSCILIWFV